MTLPSASGWRLTWPTPDPVPAATDEQRRAGEPRPGVTVALGGPGTGKSTAVVEAVAQRLASGSTIDRTVVLAGSRAAAQQVRRAIARRLGGAQVAPRVTTVHGMGLGLLREFATEDSAPRLLRAPEQELRIYELLAGMPAGFWPDDVADAARTRGFATQLREVISRSRQLGLDPDRITELARQAGDALFARFGDFFEVYLQISDLDVSLDYAELVHRTRLLLTDPDVAASVGARFDAVVADDVQEYDPAQVALLGDLARCGIPVVAFGDPDQRIGGYRGATASALPFLLALPGATRVDLGTGFRNRAAVADACAELRVRLDATARPQTPTPAGDGGVVTCRVYDDQGAEVAHVADQLRAAVVGDGLAWSDLAVVVRAGRAQVGPLARELARYGVPVEVAGDELPLADQPAVQTLILALEVAAAAGRPDADQAHRLLTSPLASLDSVRLRALGRGLLEHHRELGNSVQLLGGCLAEPALLDSVSGPEAEAATALAATLAEAAAALADGAAVGEVLWRLWDATDWPIQLREAALGGSRRANHHLDAVVELFELASRRSDLAGVNGVRTFVTAVKDLEIPADTGRELDLAGLGVRVVTAHRARAGQWARVFVVGVQEGRWPQLVRRGLLLDPERLSPNELAPATTSGLLGDERRLFHVACSRAVDQLHVSASQGVEGEAGRPSRFLSELGVPVERVHGRPSSRLSAPSLLAELRSVAGDPARSPSLRRAAALRLARLAAVADADGHRPFRAAEPADWWGLREPSGEPLTAPGSIVVNGSALRALLACPRHWFLSRQARAEGGRRSRASVGDVVHILAARGAKEDLSVEELKAELEQVWERIPFEAEWLSATERTEIDAALDRYSEWSGASSNEVIGLEQHFEVSLPVKGRTVVLRGAVDRLELENGRLKVVDIKTGKSMPQQKDMADNEQLGVYQLAAQLGAFDEVAPGVRDVAAPALVYLRKGDALPTVLDQASLDDVPALKEEPLREGPTWVHDKLADAVDIIDSGTYEARACTMCRWCQFRDSCPAEHPGLAGGLA